MEIKKQDGQEAIINGHKYIYSTDKGTYLKARDYQKHQAFKKREANKKRKSRLTFDMNALRDLDRELMRARYAMDSYGVQFVGTPGPQGISGPSGAFDVDYTEPADTPDSELAHATSVTQNGETRHYVNGQLVGQLHTETSSPVEARSLTISDSMREQYRYWRERAEAAVWGSRR